MSFSPKARELTVSAVSQLASNIHPVIAQIEVFASFTAPCAIQLRPEEKWEFDEVN